MLAPDEEAALLAEHMAAATAVHRAILEETIESGESGRMTESGRTACATVENVRPPLARYPRAVLLESCPPVQAAGLWHTHPAGDELRQPSHSLPDWANVVFGPYDVSVVTGTQSAQAVTAAGDEAAMRAAFQEAIGLEAETKRAVIDGLVRGHIDHDEAVQAVEWALSPLVQRWPLSFPDLEARADGLAPAPPELGLRTATACQAAEDAVSPDVAGIRRQVREASDAGRMVVSRVAAEGFNESIGIIAGTIVSRWLFDR